MSPFFSEIPAVFISSIKTRSNLLTYKVNKPEISCFSTGMGNAIELDTNNIMAIKVSIFDCILGFHGDLNKVPVLNE